MNLCFSPKFTWISAFFFPLFCSYVSFYSIYCIFVATNKIHKTDKRIATISYAAMCYKDGNKVTHGSHICKFCTENQDGLHLGKLQLTNFIVCQDIYMHNGSQRIYCFSLYIALNPFSYNNYDLPVAIRVHIPVNHLCSH